MLKIDERKVKSLISLKELWWENSFGTNCYAFALGLDVPENEICKNAYQPGVIAAEKFGLPIDEVLKLKLEDKFLLDLNALKIAYYETIEDQSANYRFLRNYVCYYWDVLLYSNDEDFHFVRRNYYGKLYHKIGYLGVPKECEENDEYLNQYTLVKKYRLRFWKRH